MTRIGHLNTSVLRLRPGVYHFVARDGATYEIDAARSLGSGGEGAVYVATDADGHTFAAKVSYVSHMSFENTERIMEALCARTRQGHSSYMHDHLMPIHAWGTFWARPLGRARDAELLVSIMPEATPLSGLDLAPAYVKAVVLPALAQALHVLHGMNIVHRDVKPQNVYRLGDVVVLGDFGISTMFEEGQRIGVTIMASRTAGYTPHGNAILKENDWYSLGYTLWTLYNHGVHPYQAYIEEEGRVGLSATLLAVEGGDRLIRFEPREPGDETFGQLVFGLTAPAKDLRLRHADVEAYLSDPASFRYADPQRHEATGGCRSHVHISERVASQGAVRLASGLSSRWESAKHSLCAGDVEEYLIASGDRDLAAHLHEIMETCRMMGASQDLCLAQAIWVLSGGGMLTWKGGDVSLDTLRHIFGSRDVDELEAYDEVLASGILSWSVGQAGGEKARQDHAALVAVERVAVSHPHFARCLFAHLFAGGGTSRWARESRLEDRIEAVLSSPCDLYDAAGSSDEVDDIIASLAPFAFEKDRMSELLAGYESFHVGELDETDAVCGILTIMDEVSQGSLSARRFALSHSPNAAFLWAAAHIDCYGADGDWGKMALEQLSQMRANERLDVVSILRIAERARHAWERALMEMEDNPMPYYLGYGARWRESVFALSSDALPCATFFGVCVPRGFVRQLLVASNRTSWDHCELLSDSCRETAGQDMVFQDISGECFDSLDDESDVRWNRIRFVAELVVAVILAAVCAAPFLMPRWGDFVEGGLHTSLMLLGVPFGDFFMAHRLLRVAHLTAFVFAVASVAVAADSLVELRRESCLQSRALNGLAKARSEINGFFRGTSKFARNLSSVEWDSNLPTLHIMDDIRALSMRARRQQDLRESGWYRILWCGSALTFMFVLALFISVDNSIDVLDKFAHILEGVVGPSVAAPLCSQTMARLIGVLFVAAYVLAVRLIVNEEAINVLSWVFVAASITGVLIAVACVVGAVALVLRFLSALVLGHLPLVIILGIIVVVLIRRSLV